MKSDYLVRGTRFVYEIAPLMIDCFEETASLTKRNVMRAIRFYNDHAHRAVKVCSGATRIALVTSDYVVKFDYNPANVQDFGGCEDEVEMYDYARSNGFGHLFAPIHCVYVGNYRFYVMPRVRYIGQLQNLCGWTDDEVDWVYDYVFDIHEYNYGKINGRAVLVDYAANTLA